MSDSPIFIGGLMKSGTSLLRKLMAGHPRLFGGLETFWFSDEMRDEWNDANAPSQKRFCEFFDISAEDAAELRAKSSSAIDYFNRAMWFCTQRAGKQRWIEKTPDNVLHIDVIRQNWPEASVLHVVRDYRDVFASWKARKNKSIQDFLASVHRVQSSIGKLAGTQTDWYIEIPYEDLVGDTAPTLRKAIEFVGEPWIEGLEQHEGDRAEYQKVLQATGKASSTLESLSKPIFTTSVGQWKEILSDDEVATIERELGEYMRIWNWQ